MAGNRFAILIGINDYSTLPLHYCHKDVAKVQSRLISNCKYESANIFPIISVKDASVVDVKKEYLDAIAEIRGRIDTGDSILFYYSGHGVLDRETWLEFHDHKESLQSIFDLISTLSPKDQIYIIDCCHSGSGIEIKSTVEDAAMKDFYNQQFSSKAEGIQMFCSCKPDETSKADPALDNGVYTYYLMEAIDNVNLFSQDDSHLSLTVMHEYAVKKIVLHPVYKQTPFYLIKLAGFYPFAFLNNQPEITSCKVSLQIESKDAILDSINDDALNFPPQFKNDFEKFFSELASNLFDHNYAKKIELNIIGNTMEILDHSPQSFDPFVAEITAGMGIRVYKVFMKRYQDHLTTQYIPGKPNVIKLIFDDSIFTNSYGDPCHIEISGGFSRNPAILNKYDLDLNCDEIIIDISRSNSNLSFNHMMVGEFLKRTASKKPLIILRMDPSDMIKESTRLFVLREFGDDRIMVV